MGHATTFRNRASIRTAHVDRSGGAGANEVTGSQPNPDLVSVGNFQMPTSMSPNASVPWSFTVDNDTDMNATMQDHCISDRVLNPSGTFMQISVRLDSSVVHSETNCIPDEGGQRDFNGEFFAPSTPGTYQVEVQVEGANSGDLLDRFTTSLEIEEGASPPGNCPDGFQRDPNTGECVPINGGGDGGNGDGGTDFLQQTQVILGLAALIFISIAFTSATA